MINDYITTISVDLKPLDAFAIINNVRGWWTGRPGIEGNTGNIGDEFSYCYVPHHYSKQRIEELIPGKKIVWVVLECSINFVKDKNEWRGTKIVFDLNQNGDSTEVRFTHFGLVPEIECYSACTNGWNTYINKSLRDYLTKAKKK